MWQKKGNYSWVIASRAEEANAGRPRLWAGGGHCSHLKMHKKGFLKTFPPLKPGYSARNSGRGNINCFLLIGRLNKILSDFCIVKGLLHRRIPGHDLQEACLQGEGGGDLFPVKKNLHSNHCWLVKRDDVGLRLVSTYCLFKLKPMKLLLSFVSKVARKLIIIS